MLGTIEVNQSPWRLRDQPYKACRLRMANQPIRISIFQTAQLLGREAAILRQIIGIIPPGMRH